MIYTMSFDLGNMWSKNKRHVKNHVVRNSKKNNLKKISSKQNHKKVDIIKNNGLESRGYWGTPTWYLFHTIAARVNEDYYNSNYEYIWEFITKCCGTLPCPFCREHAINYTKNIKLSEVSSKSKLQNILFDFHNVANRNNGKTIENKDVLKKYNNANIKEIFKLFEMRFFKSYIGSRMFTDWNKNIFKKEYNSFVKEINGNFV